MSKLTESDKKGPRADAYQAAQEIYTSVILASLATVNADGTPHINVCYLAPGKKGLFYFLSDPQSVHAQNLAANPACAMTIFDSAQPFGTSDKKGAQLFGTAHQLSLTESLPAFTAYAKRFPKLLAAAANPSALFAHLDSRFFEIKIESGKILHEPLFGEKVSCALKFRPVI